MTYIKDLDRATYGPFSMLPETRAVGWLSDKEPWRFGDVDEECMRRLRALHAALMDSRFETMSPAVTAGVHFCEICQANGRPLHSEQMELYVRDPSGGGYEAPAMLIHYIERHMYQPPGSFVNAVLSAESADALIREQQRASAEVLRVFSRSQP